MISNVTNQNILASAVVAIFPDHEVKKNTRKSSNISNPNTGKFLELDIWIPSLSISFEFQDPYHYTSTYLSHFPLGSVQLKDNWKNETVKQKGDTLIIVPYWWDGSHTSLQATISFYRPDLIWKKEKRRTSPIPLTPQFDSFQTGYIPNVGSLMLASFPVAMKLEESVSPLIPWWMGEKYDGVRFCWSPKTRKIYTRSGMELDSPTFVCGQFPATFLDGELWLGRGCFQDAQRIVLSISTLFLWCYFRAVVFDCPDPMMHHLPFELRYYHLLFESPLQNPLLLVAPRLLMTDLQKVEHNIKCIIDDGGEGVIMRRPKSVYEHGRSTSLLKLKASRGDREALVVLEKHDSIVLQLPEGTTFSVMKSECLQHLPVVPKKGEVVTFTYENYSKREVPVNPKLLRVRKDISWESIVADHARSVPQSQFLSESSTKFGRFAALPAQYWAVGRKKNVRLFFEKVAKAKNLDPLHSSTWYSMKREDVDKIQGSGVILAAFNGSFVNAILYAFPDIGLDSNKFRLVPNRHWHNMANKRRYFEQYARSKGFDPLDTDKWYSIQVSDFLTHKGASSILHARSKTNIFSFAKTLKEIFPELKFDDTKFPKTPTYFLKEFTNRRIVLENFANRAGFSPFLPTNWYSISADKLHADKGVASVVRMYDNSITRMLRDIFPELNLDTSRFLHSPLNYWQNESNRRKFFEDFAKQKRFDPLMPSNWSLIRTRQVVSKGGTTVLKYYGGDLQVALTHLFPEFNNSLGKMRF